MHLAVGLVFFLAVDAAFGNDDQRIIKGTVVDIEEVPYQISIEILGKHSCGGSIIHQRLIVTAAHCVQIYGLNHKLDAEVFQVRVGAQTAGEDGFLHAVEDYIPHPEFHRDPVASDIAMLLLKTPIYLSPRAQPIQLTNYLPTAGESAMVTGYGRTKRQRQGKVLRKIRIPIVPLEICKRILMTEGQTVSNDMICAGLDNGKDACQGDSGGPLVINGKLAGITSWGIGCGRESLPGMYTSVYNFHSWIVATGNRLLLDPIYST